MVVIPFAYVIFGGFNGSNCINFPAHETGTQVFSGVKAYPGAQSHGQPTAHFKIFEFESSCSPSFFTFS